MRIHELIQRKKIIQSLNENYVTMQHMDKLDKLEKLDMVQEVCSSYAASSNSVTFVIEILYARIIKSITLPQLR